MSNSRFDFIPCLASSTTKEITSQLSGAEFVLLGDTASEGFVAEHNSEIEQELDSVSEGVRVLPVGDEAEFIWSRLPTPLAPLVAPPMKTSLLVLTAEQLLQGEEELTVWEWLTQQAYTVGNFLEHSVEFQYPDHVPEGRTMPAWLMATCRALQLSARESVPDAIAIKAGLFQIHDELDISHDYAQQCQGEGVHSAGDYWHAIMHRREPDYGNSKYWFRRVGSHPVFAELSEYAVTALNHCSSPSREQWSQQLTNDGWNPLAFVDLCEESANGLDVALMGAAKAIQWREMMLLLEQTWNDATGRFG